MLKNLLKSSLIGLAAKVVSGLGSFLIIPIMLRQLGVNNYGIWVTISSTVSLIGFMDLGIGNNLVNVLARYNAEDDEHSIGKFISIAYFIQTGVTIILVSIFAALFNLIDWNGIFNLKSGSYLAVIFITFFFFLINLLTNTIYAIQRGLQRNELANTWLLINSISYLAIIYTLLMYKPSLTYVALVTFGTPVLVSLLNTAFYFSKQKIKLQFNRNIITRKSVIEFSGRGFLFLYLQLASLIAFQTDSLILAHTTSFEAISEYSLAAKLYSIPTIILSVFFQALWPKYADSAARGDWKLIRKTFKRALGIAALTVVPFILLTLVFKDWILVFWLKKQVHIADQVMIAFSVWTFLTCVIGNNLGILFNGLNILKVQLISSAAMLVCNICLSIWLSRKIGAAGVIWGSCVSSFIFSCIPLSIYLSRIFKRNLA